MKVLNYALTSGGAVCAGEGLLLSTHKQDQAQGGLPPLSYAKGLAPTYRVRVDVRGNTARTLPPNVFGSPIK